MTQQNEENKMNSTDRICKSLEAKAIKNLREKLEKATNDYNSNLGLGGTSTTILLKDSKGQEFTCNSWDVLESITEQILNKGKEKACADEVKNFLNGIQNIQSQFQSLEQYIED
jgi:hypothetical protein